MQVSAMRFEVPNGFVLMYVPDVVFRDVVIINDHDIADHDVLVINAEGLALIAVDIRLRQAADGVRDERFLLFFEL